MSSKTTPTTMRALRANKADEAPKLETIDVPSVGPDDVLIKVVCASLAPGPWKLLQMGFLKQLPTTFGHQVAGTVEKTGELVDTLQVGQRVRLCPNLSCGKCAYCGSGRDQMCVGAAIVGFAAFGKGRMPLYERYHDGGLAEYVRVPQRFVDLLPDSVSFEVGAMVHGLANAVRVLESADLVPGATVAITAPTGSMGVACVRMAHLFGIGRLVLVGRNTERLEAVKNLTSVKCDVVDTTRLGHDWTETKALVGAIRRLVPQGVDAIIDFIPSGDEVYQIFGALASGGAFVHMAGSTAKLPVPLIAIMQNDWRIIGTKNCSRADARTVLSWLGSGLLKADDLVTQRFTLDDIDQAVKELHERSSPVWTMLVKP